MQKLFSLLLAALLIAIGLIGCGGATDKAVLEAERAASAAKVAAAKSDTELRLIKEAAAKKLRQAAAQKEVSVIARIVVRDSQLTDRAGCRITPETLTKAEHYEEFGGMMVEQYRGKCATEVASYKAERKTAANKAVVAAKAKEQQRLATAVARPAKIAKADTHKK